MSSLNIVKSRPRRRRASRVVLLLMLFLLSFTSLRLAAAPRRLVLALDGIAYRDLKALQEGVTYYDGKGQLTYRQCFHEGYFPVSRLVSTFPSASDVAWTEIFANPVPPGYQRTYFEHAANQMIALNGLMIPMEYEKQMNWRVTSGVRNAISYVRPLKAFHYELDKLVEDFLSTPSERENYYAFFFSTDSAQHMACDIFALLARVENKLNELRARYRAREGCELEILVLSDHGNNHAGPGRRVPIRSFLKKAGYHITTSIHGPKDVVLPTVGIESWVEIHNVPSETERLVNQLWRLEGVDVLTAQMPGQTNQFIVVNAVGERAIVEYNGADAFRYAPETGDPLNYLPVVAALSRKGRLDAADFATSEAWQAETMGHRYPLAPERIVRGHTRIVQNPATILISLNNRYVHATWLTKLGSTILKFGGTHGGLDDLNSDGILLSSFARTEDTSSTQVATRYGGFKGMRDQRGETIVTSKY